MHNPGGLLLDEPTSGLDPRQIIETRSVIKNLGGEHTVILSTHILPEGSMTCSRVVIINGGKIAAEDTPDNLMRRLKGSERVHMEVRGPEREVRMKLATVEKVMKVEGKAAKGGLSTFDVDCALGADVREKLAATVVSNGWGLNELRPVGMSLEDIFLQLTTEEVHA